MSRNLKNGIRPSPERATTHKAPAALAVSLLYLGTAGCAIWAFFLLVLGVREVEEGSTWGDALITLLMAVLLLVAVAVAIGIAVVFLLGRFRGHAGIAA